MALFCLVFGEGYGGVVGVYTIRLTASDTAGNTVRGELLVRVGAAPGGARVLDGILLNPANPQVLVGDDLVLTATAYYTDGSSVAITDNGAWQLSNTSVASVSDVGVLSGVAAGATSVTVSFDGQSVSRPVTVRSAAGVVDRMPPVAAIGAPEPGVEVTGPVAVTGTANDQAHTVYLSNRSRV